MDKPRAVFYTRTNEATPAPAYETSARRDHTEQVLARFRAEPVSEFVEDIEPVFERYQTPRKKALTYITASAPQKRKQGDDVTLAKSSLLLNQREAIERKAAEIGADIVGEFVIPKPSNTVIGSQFQKMLNYISYHGIDYVVIYPDRPHRIYMESALIETAIIKAGAQLVSVVSVHDTDSAPELLRGFLGKLRALDVAVRRAA